MEKKHGPWLIKNITQEYKDNFIELNVHDVVKPDGSGGKYSTVKVIPAVAILAVDNDNNAYLTRQFRFAIGRQSLETVCGAVEQNELPLDAAKRELEEEAGIMANDWKHLGYIDTDTSIVNNQLNLYLAHDLSFEERNQDESEDIRIVKYDFQHVVDMVMSGEITHAPSCVLILKANEFIRNSTPKIK